MRVFISYARGDRTSVDCLAGDLTSLGHQVWLDERLLGGQEWWEEILSQIRDSDVFVLAVSPASVESDACLLELQYAEALKRPFLPILVHPTDPTYFPPEIAHAQYVDYTEDNKQSLLRLVASIDRLPRSVPLPEPLPPVASMPRPPLYEVRQLIAQPTELDRKHQLWLLDTLEQAVMKARLRPHVIELLTQFRQRGDLFADVERRLDRLCQNVGEDALEDRPGGGKLWMILLTVGLLGGVLATFYVAAAPPIPAVLWYEASVDGVIAIAILAIVARRPPFWGWILLAITFAYDAVWAPILLTEPSGSGQETLTSYLGGAGPYVLLAAAFIALQPPWQVMRRSTWRAMATKGTIALLGAGAAYGMVAGTLSSEYDFPLVFYVETGCAAAAFGAAIWCSLWDLHAVVRVSVLFAGALVLFNEAAMVHPEAFTFTAWIEFPWLAAGIFMAAAAAYCYALHPRGLPQASASTRGTFVVNR